MLEKEKIDLSFYKLDNNNDLKISKDELLLYLKSQSANEQVVKNIVQVFDKIEKEVTEIIGLTKDECEKLKKELDKDTTNGEGLEEINNKEKLGGLGKVMLFSAINFKKIIGIKEFFIDKKDEELNKNTGNIELKKVSREEQEKLLSEINYEIYETKKEEKIYSQLEVDLKEGGIGLSLQKIRDEKIGNKTFGELEKSYINSISFYEIARNELGYNCSKEQIEKRIQELNELDGKYSEGRKHFGPVFLLKKEIYYSKILNHSARVSIGKELIKYKDQTKKDMILSFRKDIVSSVIKKMGNISNMGLKEEDIIKLNNKLKNNELDDILSSHYISDDFIVKIGKFIFSDEKYISSNEKDSFLNNKYISGFKNEFNNIGNLFRNSSSIEACFQDAIEQNWEKVYKFQTGNEIGDGQRLFEGLDLLTSVKDNIDINKISKGSNIVIPVVKGTGDNVIFNFSEDNLNEEEKGSIDFYSRFDLASWEVEGVSQESYLKFSINFRDKSNLNNIIKVECFYYKNKEEEKNRLIVRNITNNHYIEEQIKKYVSIYEKYDLSYFNDIRNNKPISNIDSTFQNHIDGMVNINSFLNKFLGGQNLISSVLTNSGPQSSLVYFNSFKELREGLFGKNWKQDYIDYCFKYKYNGDYACNSEIFMDNCFNVMDNGKNEYLFYINNNFSNNLEILTKYQNNYVKYIKEKYIAQPEKYSPENFIADLKLISNWKAYAFEIRNSGEENLSMILQYMEKNGIPS